MIACMTFGCWPMHFWLFPIDEVFHMWNFALFHIFIVFFFFNQNSLLFTQGLLWTFKVSENSISAGWQSWIRKEEPVFSLILKPMLFTRNGKLPKHLYRYQPQGKFLHYLIPKFSSAFEYNLGSLSMIKVQGGNIAWKSINSYGQYMACSWNYTWNMYFCPRNRQPLKFDKF